MLEIRRIKAEELEQCRKIWTVVYNERHDFRSQKDKKTFEDPVEWRWGAFEDGKMQSCMNEIPYLMRFDYHDVKMSGIGGVGTLPEARRGGYIRLIFEKFLPKAYENGVVFSNLTPFSHAFYRKFGYELACARNEITIPTREFAELKLRGEFTQIFPGDDTRELSLVHNAYIEPLNHGIRRDYWTDDRAWQVFINEDPYSTGTFLYLWRNDGGEPKSYLKYQHEKAGQENIMRVKELAFVDREGLYGALSMVNGLSSQYNIFKWAAPIFLDPTDFITNIWAVDQHIIPRDMTRIVNVKTALSLMRRPDGEGRYTLEVTEDKQIKANNGRFLVEYDASGVHVSETTREPDMRCTVAALSQLVMGYRTLENALLTKQTDVEVVGNRRTLDKVWTLRPQHITEYF
ncbi:MAG: GNAT family N-acetyltransferase [Treponema sp.]|jgi:predicted acetyltransferase|nr:GNAT family N-acetyltransferase [Treponema sp.]